jgi:hypothetical protein
MLVPFEWPEFCRLFTMTSPKLLISRSEAGDTVWACTRCSWSIRAPKGLSDQSAKQYVRTAFESHICGDFTNSNREESREHFN